MERKLSPCAARSRQNFYWGNNGVVCARFTILCLSYRRERQRGWTHSSLLPTTFIFVRWRVCEGDQHILMRIISSEERVWGPYRF